MPEQSAPVQALSVVVTHENAATVAHCLRAFACAAAHSRFAWEIRVVDNGSKDGTTAALEGLRNRCTIGA